MIRSTLLVFLLLGCAVTQFNDGDVDYFQPPTE